VTAFVPTDGRPDKKLEAQSLVSMAHSDLQLRIANGSLKAGERLIIDRLAREYGTSLIPIREALARLCAERLIDFERNKGYRVAQKPDALELRQLFQARLIIEAGAVESGIDNVSDALIERLDTINATLKAISPAREPDVVRRFISLNQEFHVALVEMANNPFISDSYSRLGYHERLVLIQYKTGVPNGEAIVEEHEGIIAALRTKNKYLAATAMRAHILQSFEAFDFD
jgi:DNA-binding GntR family transcriptional regulator